MYDAEFWAYPVDFTMRYIIGQIWFSNRFKNPKAFAVILSKPKIKCRSSALKKLPNLETSRSGFSYLLRAPSSAIGWLMTRTFGLALIYPG